MKRQWRTGWIVLAVMLVGIATVLYLSWPKSQNETAERLQNAPLTIATSTVGNFAEGFSWHLKVDPARQAELTIDTFPNPSHKRFEIPKEQMEQFRKALLEEHFFELKGEYGEQVPDGSEQTITVILGQHSKTVKVHFLMNWVHSDKDKLREPGKAVRLLVLLRGWFTEAEAVDLRKYDQMVLDAISK